MRLHFCFVEGSADYETCYDFLSANVSVGCKLHFSGQVRNDNCEKGEVQAIVYSAYSEMVLKELNSISSELRLKYPQIFEVSIVHSLGRVDLGDDSIHVILTAAHRDGTFGFLEEFMSLFKRRVPIFKKEVFLSGTERWVANID
jgi:molybdopterin synthase catalytic subunit